MATISRTAQRQINVLRADYQKKKRPEAIQNLRQALIDAEVAVDNPATRYRSFPTTYRSLARPGMRWILVHIYWISYKSTNNQMTEDGYKVIEINCLNSAGLYASNVAKLVAAIEDMIGF